MGQSRRKGPPRAKRFVRQRLSFSIGAKYKEYIKEENTTCEISCQV